MRLVASLPAAVVLLGLAGPAHATVKVAIDLTHQRMHVESAEGSYDWPISSARSGFSTPGGSYAPTHLELMHYSKKYHMSPMPHAIFFRGGYAIHGTYSTAELGHPASHGCVRLSPGHAATLYDMVEAEGARISISGHPPASRPFAHEDYAARRSDDDGSGYADAPDSRPRVSYHYDGGDGYGYGYGSQRGPYGYAVPYTYAPSGDDGFGYYGQ